MGLSPEEEDAFTAIVSRLQRQRSKGIPWPIIAFSVVLVGAADALAALLGVHHHLATLFYGTFIAALAVGLAVMAFGDKRA